MQSKIVPSGLLSPKTLRAKDYVLTPFRVTYVEEIERDVVVHLRADTSDQAHSMLEELSDSDLIATMRRGKTKDKRYVGRRIVAVIEETSQ